MKRAVVLLSGGLDSATCLAIAREEGFESHALSFRYGQRNLVELESAGRVARTLGAFRHVVLDLDMRPIGGSALTDEIAVPKNAPGLGLPGEIPVTYVPARNTVFLSCALGLAEVIGAEDIFIGVNALDYSGYPDCRPEFIAAFTHLANLATRAGVKGGCRFKIRTPLIEMTKAGIIRKGIALGVDYALTLSCYDPGPDASACGECDSCRLRRKGFLEAGVPDPTPYRT